MSDKPLADAVAALIDALDEGDKIDRCNARGCDHLAFGEPDMGPEVLRPVCEKNEPPGTRMFLGGQWIERDALRDVFAKHAPYGIHFDPETGTRTKGPTQ